MSSALWVLALTLFLACGDSTGPAGPPQYELELVTSEEGDRAAALTVVGQVAEVRAVEGYRVFTRETSSSLKLIVVPAGDATFPTQGVVVATLEFSEADRPSERRCFVTQIASADYRLRSAGKCNVQR